MSKETYDLTFVIPDGQTHTITLEITEMSDRDKFVAAVKLFSETADLYERSRQECLAIIRRLLEANKRGDYTEAAQCTLELAHNNEEQVGIWLTQHKRCTDLFPAELQGLKQVIAEETNTSA